MYYQLVVFLLKRNPKVDFLSLEEGLMSVTFMLIEARDFTSLWGLRMSVLLLALLPFFLLKMSKMLDLLTLLSPLCLSLYLSNSFSLSLSA